MHHGSRRNEVDSAHSKAECIHIMQDDYIEQREILANYPDDQMGEIAMHCVVPRLKGTPGAIRKPAPRSLRLIARCVTETAAPRASRTLVRMTARCPG